MSWNYRVVRDKNGWHGICEVYYDDVGRPRSWSNPTPLQGESLEEMRADLIRFRVALELPILVEMDNCSLVEESKS